MLPILSISSHASHRGSFLFVFFFSKFLSLIALVLASSLLWLCSVSCSTLFVCLILVEGVCCIAPHLIWALSLCLGSWKHSSSVSIPLQMEYYSSVLSTCSLGSGIVYVYPMNEIVYLERSLLFVSFSCGSLCSHISFKIFPFP